MLGEGKVMKIKNVALSLVAAIFVGSIGYNQGQDYPDKSTSTVPLKQARGRLKAIAREYMREKQNIKSPFELHQNWKFIKKDVYKKLASKAYLDEQKHRIVNEDAIPDMADKVFKKLAKLRTDDQGERRKKYSPPVDLISMKTAINLVRDRLRKHGIHENDKPILFKEIMQELKQYKEDDNLINRKTAKFVADNIIKKFKEHKLQISNQETKSYLEQFIANSYKKRFEEQIREQDWSIVP